MAKRTYKNGKTSAVVSVLIKDSTTGLPKTGLVFNTSGLTCYYVSDQNAATAITLATLASPTASYTSGGFKEIDSTNCPGLYTFHVPNAVLATAQGVVVYFNGGSAFGVIEFDLWAIDIQDTVRAGLTALPNVAAAGAGGLFTRGTGVGQINQDANGRIDVNAVAVVADATSAANLKAMFNGTGYNASASNVGTVGTVNALANGVITAAKFATNAVDANALATDAVAEIVAAVKALVIETAGSITLGQAMSLILAFAAGRTANGGLTFKTPDNSATRIDGTVDGSNNRTAITLTPSA